ncbi:MAG: hypothetical protein ACEPOZ_11685 [Marinifilaceae bacterium]
MHLLKRYIAQFCLFFVIIMAGSSASAANQILPSKELKSVNKQLGLSGIYSIGGPNADFSTVESMLEALEKRGVNGAVEFSLSGKFQVSSFYLPLIKGVSEINSIKFVGSPNASICKRGDDEPLIFCKGAKYVTFQNLKLENKIGEVIRLENASSHVQFKNCEIIGGEEKDLVVLDDTQKSNYYNSFYHNTFSGGKFSVSFIKGVQKNSFGNAFAWNVFEKQKNTSFNGVESQTDLIIANNQIQKCALESISLDSSSLVYNNVEYNTKCSTHEDLNPSFTEKQCDKISHFEFVTNVNEVVGNELFRNDAFGNVLQYNIFDTGIQQISFFSADELFSVGNQGSNGCTKQALLKEQSEILFCSLCENVSGVANGEGVLKYSNLSHFRRLVQSNTIDSSFDRGFGNLKLEEEGLCENSHYLKSCTSTYPILSNRFGSNTNSSSLWKKYSKLIDFEKGYISNIINFIPDKGFGSLKTKREWLFEKSQDLQFFFCSNLGSITQICSKPVSSSFLKNYSEFRDFGKGYVPNATNFIFNRGSDGLKLKPEWWFGNSQDLQFFTCSNSGSITQIGSKLTSSFRLKKYSKFRDFGKQHFSIASNFISGRGSIDPELNADSLFENSQELQFFTCNNSGSTTQIGSKPTSSFRLKKYSILREFRKVESLIPIDCNFVERTLGPKGEESYVYEKILDWCNLQNGNFNIIASVDFDVYVWECNGMKKIAKDENMLSCNSTILFDYFENGKFINSSFGATSKNIFSLRYYSSNGDDDVPLYRDQYSMKLDTSDSVYCADCERCAVFFKTVS